MMATSIDITLSGRVIDIIAQHLGTSPEDLSITRLSGDASTRAYFRAKSAGASCVVALYGEPFDETESAASRLARLEAENPSIRLSFANDPCAHLEVTALFEQAMLPVPRVLAASGSDGVLRIAEVGDTCPQDWLVVHTEDESKAAYRRAEADGR